MLSHSNLARAAGMLLLVATGCSGGGNGSPATPQPTATATASPSASAPSPASRTLGKAVATIRIPAKHPVTASRGRTYVSPYTQSVVIDAIRSDGAVEETEQGLTSTANGCAQQQDGSTLCSVPFQAPITAAGQTDEFQITLSDTNPPDAGNALSYGDSTGNTVASAGTNNFSVVLGGVIGAIGTSSPPPTTVTGGNAQNIDILPTFADADANPIDAAFDDPASVTIAGSAAASFSIMVPAPVDGVASIPDPTKLPNGSIVIRYDGSGTNGSSATITLSSNSPQTASDFGTQITNVLTVTVQEPT